MGKISNSGIHGSEDEVRDDDESRRTDRLIGLVDAELQQLRSESQRLGWTIWALLGGIATSLWLLSGEITRGGVSWLQVCCGLLFFSLFCDGLLALNDLLSRAPTKSRQGTRFIPLQLALGETRVMLLAILVRSSLLLGIAVSCSDLVKVRLYPVIYVHYGIMGFLSVGGLILSFLQLPIVLPLTSRLSPPQRLLAFLLAGLPLAGASCVAYSFSSQGLGASIMDLRVAGLLFAAMTLSLLLVTPRPESPLLPALLDIRRRLGLGMADIDMATREVDIALAGMEVADVLQEAVGQLLACLSEGQDHLVAVSSELGLIEENLPSKGLPLSEERRTRCAATARSTISRMDEVSKITAEVKRVTKRLDWQERLVLRLAPKAAREIDAVVARVDEAIESYEEITHQVQERAVRVRESLETVQLPAAAAQPQEEGPSSHRTSS